MRHGAGRHLALGEEAAPLRLCWDRKKSGMHILTVVKLALVRDGFQSRLERGAGEKMPRSSSMRTRWHEHPSRRALQRDRETLELKNRLAEKNVKEGIQQTVEKSHMEPSTLATWRSPQNMTIQEEPLLSFGSDIGAYTDRFLDQSACLGCENKKKTAITLPIQDNGFQNRRMEVKCPFS